jgi:uncharacterized protein YpmS
LVNQTLKRPVMTPKKNRSIWFWLFWVLVAGLVLTSLWFFHQASGPVKYVDSKSKIAKSDATFDITLNKKQINALVAHYLNDSDNSGFTFDVSDQVMMYGSTKFLGQKFNFGMALDPQVTTNGNIILKAKSLAIGNLSLPVSTVMSFVRSSYDAPKYVTIMPKKKEIFVDMSQLPTTQGLTFRAKIIDMKADQFVFEGGLVDEKK